MSQKFNPTRIIVLSELSAREKEKYYQIVLSNKLKFRPCENGQYITNLRILAPGIKKAKSVGYVVGTNVNSNKTIFNLENRFNQLDDTVPLKNIFIINENSFDFTPYYRFVKCIASETDTISPKLYTLTALMKRIESLYDARQFFANQHNEIPHGIDSFISSLHLSSSNHGGNSSNTTMNQPISAIFPFFVIYHLSTVMGSLKSVINQQCWDLLLSVDTYRRSYLEVEIFARFLLEQYILDDLLFFLHVRSIISHVLKISPKSQWGSNKKDRKRGGVQGSASSAISSSWSIRLRECKIIARMVFGAATMLIPITTTTTTNSAANSAASNSNITVNPTNEVITSEAVLGQDSTAIGLIESDMPADSNTNSSIQNTPLSPLPTELDINTTTTEDIALDQTTTANTTVAEIATTTSTTNATTAIANDDDDDDDDVNSTALSKQYVWKIFLKSLSRYMTESIATDSPRHNNNSNANNPNNNGANPVAIDTQCIDMAQFLYLSLRSYQQYIQQQQQQQQQQQYQSNESPNPNQPIQNQYQNLRQSSSQNHSLRYKSPSYPSATTATTGQRRAVTPNMTRARAAATTNTTQLLARDNNNNNNITVPSQQHMINHTNIITPLTTTALPLTASSSSSRSSSAQRTRRPPLPPSFSNQPSQLRQHAPSRTNPNQPFSGHAAVPQQRLSSQHERSDIHDGDDNADDDNEEIEREEYINDEFYDDDNDDDYYNNDDVDENDYAYVEGDEVEVDDMSASITAALSEHQSELSQTRDCYHDLNADYDDDDDDDDDQEFYNNNEDDYVNTNTSHAHPQPLQQKYQHTAQLATLTQANIDDDDDDDDEMRLIQSKSINRSPQRQQQQYQQQLRPQHQQQQQQAANSMTTSSRQRNNKPNRNNTSNNNTPNNTHNNTLTRNISTHISSNSLDTDQSATAAGMAAGLSNESLGDDKSWYSERLISLQQLKHTTATAPTTGGITDNKHITNNSNTNNNNSNNTNNNNNSNTNNNTKNQSTTRMNSASDNNSVGSVASKSSRRSTRSTGTLDTTSSSQIRNLTQPVNFDIRSKEYDSSLDAYLTALVKDDRVEGQLLAQQLLRESISSSTDSANTTTGTVITGIPASNTTSTATPVLHSTTTVSSLSTPAMSSSVTGSVPASARSTTSELQSQSVFYSVAHNTPRIYQPSHHTHKHAPPLGPVNGTTGIFSGFNSRVVAPVTTTMTPVTTVMSTANRLPVDNPNISGVIVENSIINAMDTTTATADEGINVMKPITPTTSTAVGISSTSGGASVALMSESARSQDESYIAMRKHHKQVLAVASSTLHSEYDDKVYTKEREEMIASSTIQPTVNMNIQYTHNDSNNSSKNDNNNDNNPHHDEKIQDIIISINNNNNNNQTNNSIVIEVDPLHDEYETERITADDDMDFDAYIELQLQREKEFLATLCAPLLQVRLPVGVTEEIIAELALHLREKLDISLMGAETSENDGNNNVFNNLDNFDTCLMKTLQSPQLISDMQTYRAELLEYLFQFMAHHPESFSDKSENHQATRTRIIDKPNEGINSSASNNNSNNNSDSNNNNNDNNHSSGDNNINTNNNNNTAITPINTAIAISILRNDEGDEIPSSKEPIVMSSSMNKHVMNIDDDEDDEYY